MKIKLKRALWNAKKDETIEVTTDRATWAINKGLAEKVDPEIETMQDKIEPGVRGRKRKNK